MKFSIKDFFSKCDQIRSILRIWSHLLKEFLMENFIFCAVYAKYLWCILTTKVGYPEQQTTSNNAKNKNINSISLH